MAKQMQEETVIGRGTSFRGVLELKHGIQVHGSLKGERITTEKALIVGEDGTVKSEVIEVTDAVVSGRVTGTLKARDRVHLRAGSGFVGQIETRRLVVEEGAVLHPD